jgi:hypothetical protein
MRSFSASDAALEGFQLLRSHWRLVVGWALFNLLAMVAVVIAFVIIGVVTVMVAGGDSRAFGQAVGGPVVSLATIGIQLVIGAAVYRLIFRPQERGFLYLRFGPDELRSIAAAVIFVAGIGALALLAAWIGGLLRPMGLAGPIIVALVAIVVGYWLMMRLGLVLPMCVAERRLDFVRSWRLTRSHGWALTGMTLLAGSLTLLVTVLVWGLFFILTLATVGFRELGNLAGPEGLRDHPGLFLLQAIAPFLLSPFIITLSSAPWADAFKALSAPQDVD